jgi:CRISPR/Cas system Type II protein with McrA/HNH and RuvC-like nuclease domain
LSNKKLTKIKYNFLDKKMSNKEKMSNKVVTKSEFTQMIDETLIHTIDDDLVINVGTLKALIPLISQGILEKDQLHTILTVLDVFFWPN